MNSTETRCQFRYVMWITNKLDCAKWLLLFVLSCSCAVEFVALQSIMMCVGCVFLLSGLWSPTKDIVSRQGWNPYRTSVSDGAIANAWFRYTFRLTSCSSLLCALVYLLSWNVVGLDEWKPANISSRYDRIYQYSED